jgi:hypothetical protein
MSRDPLKQFHDDLLERPALQKSLYDTIKFNLQSKILFYSRNVASEYRELIRMQHNMLAKLCSHGTQPMTLVFELEHIASRKPVFIMVDLEYGSTHLLPSFSYYQYQDYPDLAEIKKFSYKYNKTNGLAASLGYSVARTTGSSALEPSEKDKNKHKPYPPPGIFKLVTMNPASDNPNVPYFFAIVADDDDEPPNGGGQGGEGGPPSGPPPPPPSLAAKTAKAVGSGLVMGAKGVGSVGAFIAKEGLKAGIQSAVSNPGMTAFAAGSFMGAKALTGLASAGVSGASSLASGLASAGAGGASLLLKFGTKTGEGFGITLYGLPPCLRWNLPRTRIPSGAAAGAIESARREFDSALEVADSQWAMCVQARMRLELFPDTTDAEVIRFGLQNVFESLDYFVTRVVGDARIPIKHKLVEMIATYLRSPTYFQDKYLNFCLTGGAGTGKTTIAVALGKLLNSLGILITTKMSIESRSSLVATYLGQTASKTRGQLVAALEGVMFVDEAYSLANAIGGHGYDAYGVESINEFINFMDKTKGRIAIIAAGYEREIMQFWFGPNEGMARRMPHIWKLENYSAQDLFEISTVFYRLEFERLPLVLPHTSFGEHKLTYTICDIIEKPVILLQLFQRCCDVVKDEHGAWNARLRNQAGDIENAVRALTGIFINNLKDCEGEASIGTTKVGGLWGTWLSDEIVASIFDNIFIVKLGDEAVSSSKYKLDTLRHSNEVVRLPDFTAENADVQQKVDILVTKAINKLKGGVARRVVKMNSTPATSGLPQKAVENLESGNEMVSLSEFTIAEGEQYYLDAKKVDSILSNISFEEGLASFGTGGELDALLGRTDRDIHGGLAMLDFVDAEGMPFINFNTVVRFANMYINNSLKKQPEATVMAYMKSFICVVMCTLQFFDILKKNWNELSSKEIKRQHALLVLILLEGDPTPDKRPANHSVEMLHKLLTSLLLQRGELIQIFENERFVSFVTDLATEYALPGGLFDFMRKFLRAFDEQEVAFGGKRRNRTRRQKIRQEIERLKRDPQNKKLRQKIIHMLRHDSHFDKHGLTVAM